MSRYAPFGFAAAFALLSSVALASPQIPSPANPFPDEPVTTDGLPLKPSFDARARDGFRALSSDDRPFHTRRHR